MSMRGNTFLMEDDESVDSFTRTGILRVRENSYEPPTLTPSTTTTPPGHTDGDDDVFWVRGEDRKPSHTQIILYKRRWFMLFIFSLNAIGNTINFSTIAAINDVACVYYRVSPESVNWIPNLFLLVYTLVGLPSAYLINILGLRRSLIIGSSLNAACCCLHFAGSGRDGFLFVILGNVCAALAVGVVLQVQP